MPYSCTPVPRPCSNAHQPVVEGAADKTSTSDNSGACGHHSTPRHECSTDNAASTPKAVRAGGLDETSQITERRATRHGSVHMPDMGPASQASASMSASERTSIPDASQASQQASMTIDSSILSTRQRCAAVTIDTSTLAKPRAGRRTLTVETSLSPTARGHWSGETSESPTRPATRHGSVHMPDLGQASVSTGASEKTSTPQSS